MKSFLEYVAEDIIGKYGTELADTVVVFPNKRASLFLNDYLAHAAGKPLWSPAYITISDLFRSHSKLVVGDDIKLVCDLHKSFRECTGIDEPLDHFYGWGQLLLSDFDDLDKNMAEADKVFATLRDIHELDGVSYLSEVQFEAIKKFFSNFSEEHNSELKERFIRLWSKLYDIYLSFNTRLASQGLAYEGALYRSVATDESIVFEHERYLFVGFNLLHKVESNLFKRLKASGQAKFYWDFDSYYMPSDKSIQNEAGHYIASYLADFPNELDTSSTDIYCNFDSRKSITYISASTETIQARYASKWLKRGKRIADGRKTAVVLCDESLLKAVIHSLPDDVGEVNITTGYPLIQSPLTSFIRVLVALQTIGYSPNRDRYRLHHVNMMLNHPYMHYISAQYGDLYQRLNKDGKVYYPGRKELCIDEGTELLFGGIDMNNEDVPLSGRLTSWLIRLLRLVARNSVGVTAPLFQESLFRMYTLLNRLDGLITSRDLLVDVNTLQRLMNQIIQTTSIPFHGEPAVGVQVMGVLETRNLDFDHLLILSCNEGNMPKGLGETSFIPYSLRKAYGLTTIDNKVAVYSYYFHRLLQRASDITIMYNESVSNSSTGEMSRFMSQIMIESSHVIEQKRLQSGQVPTLTARAEMPKTAEIMTRLLSRFDVSQSPASQETALLTPSAINRYMRCQLQFYFNYVCGIKELTEDDDSIDNRVFGNIFHSAAQKLYEHLSASGGQITKSMLQALLKSSVSIEQAVDEAFNDELFNGAIRKPEYNGLQLINRKVIAMYLHRLVEVDIEQAPFSIIGLETDVAAPFEVSSGANRFTTMIGGRVDRIDLVDGKEGKRLRVVDYKTGGRKIKPLSDLEAVFDPAMLKEHSDYYLQAMLYSMIVGRNADLNKGKWPTSPALLFIQHTVGEGYDPTLLFGKKPIIDAEEYHTAFMGSLKVKVDEMFNPEMPFAPTSDENICKNCPYSRICGA